VLDDNVYVRGKIPPLLRVRDNDILICSRNGSPALVGKNAKISGAAVGSSFGAFTTVFRSQLSNFLYYVFNSQLLPFQTGRFLTTTINQLTTSTLKGYHVLRGRHGTALTEYLLHCCQRSTVISY
jgi:type I restriction enzyme, S subunit